MSGARVARGYGSFLALPTVVTAVITIGIGAFIAIDRTPLAAGPTRPVPTLTVTSTTPRQVSWLVTLEASGAIAPWHEASVGTQVGGCRLVDVLANVGDQVKKGQVLARLDPDLLRAEEAQLKARYEQADANRQRALTLKNRGYVSDKDVLQTETDAKTADALLASKQLQLRYTEVVAPDDGAISSRTATLGAVGSVGQELFRLIRQNRLEWRGELTAPQLAQIVTGQRIALTLPDGSSAAATVRQTAPTLDSQSRLGIVYADLEPDSRARAGMYAAGRIVLDKSAALVVPAESVVVRDGRNFVLELADAGALPTVSLRAVTVGRRVGSEVEITAGLTTDDRVVMLGAGFLADGDVVRLVAPGGEPRGDADPNEGPKP